MKKTNILFSLFFSACLGPARVWAINSQGSGNWSDPATWAGGVAIPTQSDPVTISPGHTVIVDITTATASTTTVLGTLFFHRTSSSTLTMVGGDLTVGNVGTLDMGAAGSPIQPGARAELVLARGAGPIRYRLFVVNGGVFTLHGRAKTPAVTAPAQGVLGPGAVSVAVPAADAATWDPGDLISIGQTARTSPFQMQTETATITNVSGGTVDFVPALRYSHDTAEGVRVVNLTRNAVVRSSGTNASSDTAFIRNDTAVAANFQAVHGEFVGIGADISYPLGPGIRFTSGAAGSISSSTVRWGGSDCFLLENPNGGTVLRDVAVFGCGRGVGGPRPDVRGGDIYGHALYGFQNTGAAVPALLSGVHAYSNGLDGVNLINAVAPVVSGGRFYANGGTGLVLYAARDGDVTGNEVFANTVTGVSLTLGGGHVVSSNTVRGHDGTGLSVSGSSVTVAYNLVRDNTGFGGGVRLQNAWAPRVISNRILNNGTGIILTGTSGGLLIGNEVSSAGTGTGVNLTSSGDNLFVRNHYALCSAGVSANASFNNVHFQDRFGYDLSGASAANQVFNFSITVASAGGAVFKEVRLNPLTPGGLGVFNDPGTYLLSYDQDFASGTVRLMGDYTHSAGTLALDRAQPLYRATATTPVLLRGAGHSLQASGLDDATVVAELITVRREGGFWRVEGSTTGFFANYTGGAQDFGPFTLTLTEGGAPAEGDRLSFALLSASPDAGLDKRLYFGSADAAFNGGRSRLTVAPGAGLLLRGAVGAPAVMDRINAGNNHYTVVSSGDLTLENALVQNMDAQGMLMSGSGTVAMSSVTFDYSGNTSPTLAYLSPSNLTSNATFYAMRFLDTPNRLGSGFPLYSVNAPGAGPGLRWYFNDFSGAVSGDASDNDPNRRIFWADSAPPSAPGSFTAGPGSSSGEVSLSWTSPGDDGMTGPILGGSFRLFRSTNPADLPAAPSAQDVVMSTTASPGSAHSYVDGGLLLETTYYYRLWAGDELGNFSPFINAQGVASGQITPPQAVLSAGARSLGVAWDQLLTLAFTKPMDAASVLGSISLRRTRDNLGNGLDEPWVHAVSNDPSGTTFTVTPDPLAGNSLYELSVATTALDAQGKAMASSTTLRFTTALDRSTRNVVTEGLLGISVEVPPYAFGAAAYIAGAAAPAGPVTAAALKLVSNTGDRFRTLVPGTDVDLEAFDVLGAPQGFSIPLTVSLPYPDANDDGVVDGTEVKAKTLKVHWLNERDGVWVPLPSTVDGAADRVSAAAPHFTVFALFGAGDLDLAGAYAYPSPFRPSRGRSFVTFTALGQSATVRVYTVDGELVRTLAGDPDGTKDWDVKDDDGAPLASGIYVYRVTNSAGSKSGKLVVLR